MAKIVLAVESSCDETACAVVKDGREVLSSLIASQIDVHRVFGGVVPEIAAREHLRVVDQLTRQALEQSSLRPTDVDVIAVTQGPGLIGALLVGIAYAKGVACALQKPLVPVNHVHAHIHGALLGLTQTPEHIFPTIALVASGGHTNLYYMRDALTFELLGASIDDACGECFDKTAKLLGLPYPGGPKIERLAMGGNASKVVMPHMVAGKDRLDFSYSGLKTHMATRIQSKSEWSESELADLCASFQEEALGQLVRKISSALEKRSDAQSVLIAGGVAANTRFREMLKERISVEALFPPLAYCSDNAAMIAALGWESFNMAADKAPFFDYTWDAFSRYPYPV